MAWAIGPLPTGHSGQGTFLNTRAPAGTFPGRRLEYVLMWTSDADADAALSLLVDGHRRVLGTDLVGSYLYGSAATGAFEPGVSDLDAVAVLRSDPTESQLAGLRELHASIVRELPEWDGRVEVVYLSTRALMTFMTPSPAARISPGEPFHPIEVDRRWLIDWYQLRTVGIALHGPTVVQVAPLITQGEYVEGVRQHLLDPAWLDASVGPGGSLLRDPQHVPRPENLPNRRARLQA